jgi:hypothetical protein
MGYRIIADVHMDTPAQEAAFRDAEALGPDDDVRDHLRTLVHTELLGRGLVTGGWETVTVY